MAIQQEEDGAKAEQRVVLRFHEPRKSLARSCERLEEKCFSVIIVFMRHVVVSGTVGRSLPSYGGVGLFSTN